MPYCVSCLKYSVNAIVAYLSSWASITNTRLASEIKYCSLPETIALEMIFVKKMLLIYDAFNDKSINVSHEYI